MLDRLLKVGTNLRLGWDGAAQRFGLIELRPQRFAFTSIVGTRWEHGPVFGKHFDPIAWIPIYILDVPIQDVFNSGVIDVARRWAGKFAPRALAARRQQGREYEAEVSSLAAQQADYMLHRAKRSDTCGAVAVARRHLTPAERGVLDGTFMERPEMQLENAFMESPKGSGPLQ